MRSTPPGGPDREPWPLGPSSLMWELVGDQRTMLAFPAVLLMHTSHPVIGQAVGEYSAYREDPWGRLTRSVDSLLTWVYGGDEALAEGRRLRELHRTIQVVDGDGARHHANAFDNYFYVHATLYERIVTTQRLFGTPLTVSEQDQLYDEFLQIGANFLIPTHLMPGNRLAFWDYWDRTVAEVLVDNPVPHDVLAVMRRDARPVPGLPSTLQRAWGPAWRNAGGIVGAWLAVATLPPELKSLLGVAWTSRDEFLLRQLGNLTRSTVPHLPERLRYLPFAYEARAMERAHRRVAARRLLEVAPPPAPVLSETA